MREWQGGSPLLQHSASHRCPQLRPHGSPRSNRVSISRAPKRVAATPPVSQVRRPSAGLTRPPGETTAGEAHTQAPGRAEPARHALRMTSPAGGQNGDVSASAPPAPPPLAEAQKSEKQHDKPVIPADAGFD